MVDVGDADGKVAVPVGTPFRAPIERIVKKGGGPYPCCVLGRSRREIQREQRRHADYPEDKSARDAAIDECEGRAFQREANPSSDLPPELTMACHGVR